jgi:DNA-binding transcriptional LysR family regulator
MENFRLKVFRTVAEKLNFRQAAEALYLTQPAITLQIKALEAELGVSLFDRSGNHISLTTAGKTLLPFAREMAKVAATAQRELALLKGEEYGELRVGASTTVAQYLLPKLAGEFKSLYPGIHLSVIGANTARIVASLIDGSIALGLVEGPTMRRDLRTEQFLADHIAVIASGHHEWVGQPVSIQQFAKAKLILREVGSGTRRVVEAALRHAGVRITPANLTMELDSTEAIKSAVEAGLGIGFVPRRAIEKELKLGTLAELDVEKLSIERHFSILSLRGAEPSGAAGAFLRFLRSVRDAGNGAR